MAAVASELSSVFHSTEASLARRARIARTISPLKPARPRVPFWKLAAHRIPTLWTLYRGLLGSAPTEDIRWRIRKIFESNRHLTSPASAKEKLLTGHRWLDIFVRAQQGDPHLQAVLQRYSRMIVAKSEKEEFKEVLRREAAWLHKLRNRPIITGGYFRPTLYNGPLPRMNPQPDHVSGMIYWRRKARDRRSARYAVLADWLDDLRRESAFETRLAQEARKSGDTLTRCFSDNLEEWEQIIKQHMYDLRRTFNQDEARRRTPFPPELLAQIKAARREKVENKTREYQREARGEVIRRTILRRKQGPPAHVLTKMTSQERHLDRVSRSSVSEVGYVGMVKKKLGWKLRNPEAWKAEDGKEEDWPTLDAVEEEIRRKNRERQAGVKNELEE